MKKNLYLCKAVLLSVIVLVIACRKSMAPDPKVNIPPDLAKTSLDTTRNGPIPYPQSTSANCAYIPDYGDSIIFSQPTASGVDYIVHPVNTPVPGRFLSWPEGLVIDSSSGAINVTQSITGTRYSVGFVKAGTTDTCLETVILSGADYADSVYVLANNENHAPPFFEANSNNAAQCNSGPACHFDITGSAKAAGVNIDNGHGIIDLGPTLTGVFGNIPIDGTSANIVFYYTLNDPSNNAVQKMQIQLMYYTSKSLIPLALLNQINSERLNGLLNNLIDFTSSPRPPIIIITRLN
jgi:hypothetical protein